MPGRGAVVVAVIMYWIWLVGVSGSVELVQVSKTKKSLVSLMEKFCGLLGGRFAKMLLRAFGVPKIGLPWLSWPLIVRPLLVVQLDDTLLGKSGFVFSIE